MTASVCRSKISAVTTFQIDIVIVATNDPPIIYMGVPEYLANEDVLTHFYLDSHGLPISFTDVDNGAYEPSTATFPPLTCRDGLVSRPSMSAGPIASLSIFRPFPLINSWL